jgi:hypothetical protein
MQDSEYQTYGLNEVLLLVKAIVQLDYVRCWSF